MRTCHEGWEAMFDRRISLSILALALVLPKSAAGQTQESTTQATPAVTARFATSAMAQGEPNMAIVLADQGSIVGTAELSGLEIYDRDGRRVDMIAAGEAAGVDIRQGVSIDGQPASLLAAIDATTNSLWLFRSDGPSLPLRWRHTFSAAKPRAI